MESSEPRPGAPETPSRPGRVWLVSLAAGLFAGVLAAAGGEMTYPAFRPNPQYPANFDTMNPAEKTAVRGEVRFRSRLLDERNKATAAFGVLGVVLGVVMGLAGGAGRARRGGAVMGGLVGGLAGAGLSWALVPPFFESSDAQTGLPLLFLTHLAIFTAVGIAAGLAFGWGWGERRAMVRCAIGGFVGAIVGTLAFEVINFVAFPNLRMYEPVPLEPVPRTLVHLSVAGAIGLFVGFAARKLRPRQS